jgi:translation initiation factor IF-2
MGQSDSDPQDPPGQGRGGQNRAPTGHTDTDPSDPPGRGRGGKGT